MSNSSKKDETKKYNSSEVNKKTSKKVKKQNSKKGKKQKGKIGKIIKILIITLIIAIIIGCGVAVGVFYGMFGDELKISKDELVIPYENSTVYDKDGNLLATLSGGTKRKCISLSEMGEYLPKAYVAIEDERFYEHRGVDIKRTGAATVTYITHAGSSSFGGSTITQQLVKNITNDKEDSDLAGVVRKVKEMAKAVQVEEYLSKDQILELYLNLIFIGGNDINGVELGALYYFNKQPSELSIAECAFMAGINNSPNAYKPFDQDEDGKNMAIINKRTKTVLSKMNSLGYISQEQYDEAVAEVDNGLPFSKGDTSPTIEVSYVVEAALQQILDQLVEEKGMTEAMAETYLYSGGLKIYTTEDSAVQATLEGVITQDKYYTEGKSKKKDGTVLNQNSTPTMVIMDHKTGSVVAAATAIGNKGERVATTNIGYLNIPTTLRKQTGSSMKPIAVIAPGLETGTITGGTVYEDAQTTFGGNYTPKNYYEGFRGPMTMRHAIEISANIPHVKALADIGLEKSIAFCESVGLPKFEEEGLSLALGGLSKGVTVTEMAGAYATIANDGTFIEPTFYSKVTDKEDNVVIEPDQTTNEVMSVENAYLEKSILTETVVGSEGTAKYCAVPGIQTSAKTGTTNDDYDRWLCGFTPYYTAVCWYGYETNATVKYSGNPAGKIWAEVMKEIHKDLPNAEFEKPEAVVSATICKGTGLKASSNCSATYTEYFASKDQIPESCSGHTMLMICTQTNLLCCEGCPFGEWRYYNGVPPKEKETKKWKTNYDGVTAGSAPKDVCPHTGSPLATPTPATPVVETSNVNTSSDATSSSTSTSTTNNSNATNVTPETPSEASTTTTSTPQPVETTQEQTTTAPASTPTPATETVPETTSNEPAPSET